MKYLKTSSKIAIALVLVTTVLLLNACGPQKQEPPAPAMTTVKSK